MDSKCSKESYCLPMRSLVRLGGMKSFQIVNLDLLKAGVDVESMDFAVPGLKKEEVFFSYCPFCGHSFAAEKRSWEKRCADRLKKLEATR